MEACGGTSEPSPKHCSGGIFKNAALQVLNRTGRLMTTGDITKMAVETGLIKCQGRTPEATMASALYTDVKRKLFNSVFTRPQEGLFGLREWITTGFVPECPDTGVGADGPPHKKQRTGTKDQIRHLVKVVSSKSDDDMFWPLDVECEPDTASDTDVSAPSSPVCEALNHPGRLLGESVLLAFKG
eukprot:jgi/Botrbrau1/12982/Bobra.384_1s0007.1